MRFASAERTSSRQETTVYPRMPCGTREINRKRARLRVDSSSSAPLCYLVQDTVEGQTSKRRHSLERGEERDYPNLEGSVQQDVRAYTPGVKHSNVRVVPYHSCKDGHPNTFRVGATSRQDAGPDWFQALRSSVSIYIAEESQPDSS